MGLDLPMRLDHVSYVTSHDQLADTVQRLGARLSSTFVDGGIVAAHVMTPSGVERLE
jgi:hypothetical protein